MSAYAQNAVKGKVTDDQNQPLPGVSVIEKGTTHGTVTDIDGAFVLEDLPSEAVIVFSFIGYESQEITRAGQPAINVKLLPDVKTLEEVVVVGYGTQKKSVATASLSKVEAKDLQGFGTARVDQMLQGQVAGVTFKTSSGQPGSGMSVLIRGVGTNGDNSPLYIVDGIVVNDAILQSLNPGDIESIQILKDGASTAIYGARGANGIIQVTTKKGKEGATKFSYTGTYGVQSPWKIPSMMNSSQYVDIITEKYHNGNTTLPAGFPDQNSIEANTNWMDRVFQTGTTQSHVLSVLGGTKAGSVNASVSYFDQKGVVAPDKSYYKRLTARINSEHKINDFLTFGENVFLVHSNNGRIPENSEFGTPLGDALVYDPTTPAYNPGAQYGFAQSPFVQKEYINPLSQIFISNNTNTTDEANGNAYFRIAPLKGLTITSDIGIDYIYNTGKSFTPSYSFTPAIFNTINDIGLSVNRSYRWQWENYATYSTSISKHNLSATLGTTMQIRDNGTGFGASSSGIDNDLQFNKNLWYITNTPDSMQRAYSYGAERQALRSLFGRLTYNYDEKYLASFTMRQDGSTQFGAQHRFGYFPSASAGWAMSRENFWPKSVVNFAKLRASYGVNGNDRIQSLMYTSLIERTATYPLGKPGNETIYNGYSQAVSPNPALQWEESHQSDIGIELGLWNDALTLEIDYYNKITDKLLMPATVPDYLGTKPPIANVGRVSNKGIEIELNYRQNFGDVRVQLGFTAATLKNKVTKMSTPDAYQNGYTWPIRNAVISRMDVGRPIGYFRGYESAGVFKNQDEIYAHINSKGDLLQPNAKPGDLKYVDINNDGVIDIKDVTMIGKPWADLTLGFTGSAQYKGFDFRMLWAGSFGNDQYRSYERQDVPNNNYTTAWLDRWSESNPNGKYPRVTTNDANNNTRPSSFYVENASFVRLRNLQIGYSIPAAILRQLKMSACRIYVSADNLLTITKYSGFDPEVGSTFNPYSGSYNIMDTGIDKGFYPQMKTFSGGINVTF
jgi:TonB-linked SusC/RagA family outer membrane protein